MKILYVGGVEHAILHLLYARFYTKFLYDIDAIDFDEPFSELFTQGMIYKDGYKMSKSKQMQLVLMNLSKSMVLIV